MAGSERIRGFLRGAVPGASVVAGYRREWLRSDLVAGVTVAAYVLPAGLADASIARLPPEAGLYACLVSALVFWLFCSSRHTVVTTTGAISLLVGVSLQPLDGGDPARHAALAAAAALIVGALGLLAWVVRAGVLVNFISETVLIGFKCGVAFQIGSTQLPKLFGFPGGHGNFWEQVAHFVRDIDQTNSAALLVGGSALALLAFSKRFLPRIPMGLIVVVAGIAVSAAAGLSRYGVKLLGAVPQGLPPIALPAMTWADADALMPIAMACFLLGAVETAAIGRMFGKAHGYRFEANPEFLALAAANVAAGVAGGFPVSGGMSQSLVNESSGARSVVSGLVSAVILLLVTVFLSGALRDLPQPVLAAIVIAAIAGLVKVKAIARIWRFSKGEFVVCMVAFVGVLHVGLLKGVLLGAVMSLIVLLRRGSRPYTAELGRIPGSDVFADTTRHPEYAFEPDVFVFRASSPLLYFNAEFVSDSFFTMLARRAGPVRLAVFFLGNVPGVDIAGAEMLIETARAVRARGIDFHLAEVHGPVRHHLRAAGYEDACGPIDKHQTVDALVRAWRAAQNR